MKSPFGLLAWIVLCLSICESRLYPQNDSVTVDSAIELLTHSKPLEYPAFSLGLTDQQKREAANSLFTNQMKAINRLKTVKDSSVVPILIPYLNYTSDGIPLCMRTCISLAAPPANTLPELQEQCPAFAAILAIPNADLSLSKYVTNRANPLDYRVASVIVLRYLNKELFAKAYEVLMADFDQAGPSTHQYLAAIKSGEQSFIGIYPLDPTR